MAAYQFDEQFVAALGLFAAAAPALFAAEVLRLAFSPSPIARFEEELEQYRREHRLASKSRAETAPLALRFDRDYARPGDRWLEGHIILREAPPERGEIEVELFALGRVNRSREHRRRRKASAGPWRPDDFGKEVSVPFSAGTRSA